MSVRFDGDRVRLEGDCPVEDAEALLQLLQNHPSCAIDLADCGRLHMAVMQVLLAAGRQVMGTPANAFAREWLIPQLLNPDRST
jgi:hypothetical protein